MLNGNILCNLVRNRTRFNNLHQHIIRIRRCAAALQIIAELAVCVRADRTSCTVLEYDQWTLAGCVERCVPFFDGVNFP